MRQVLLNAFKAHAVGHIEKHCANIEVYLNNPAGIGEHPDIIAAMETEMHELAKYDELLDVANKYFPDNNSKS